MQTTPMTMLRIRDAVIGLVLAALVGCARGTESVSDYEVGLAVKRYNETLQEAYARGSTEPLSETATPNEAQRIDDILGFLAQGKRVMDARQESLERGPVTYDGEDKAHLDATEVWWYRHWTPATGEVQQAPRRVRYKTRYDLLKIEGRWRIDKLSELGYEELSLER